MVSRASYSASSTARKLSPGTQKARSTPWRFSASTRIWPPLRRLSGSVMVGDAFFGQRTSPSIADRPRRPQAPHGALPRPCYITAAVSVGWSRRMRMGLVVAAAVAGLLASSDLARALDPGLDDALTIYRRGGYAEALTKLSAI